MFERVGSFVGVTMFKAVGAAAFRFSGEAFHQLNALGFKFWIANR